MIPFKHNWTADKVEEFYVNVTVPHMAAQSNKMIFAKIIDVGDHEYVRELKPGTFTKEEFQVVADALNLWESKETSKERMEVFNSLAKSTLATYVIHSAYKLDIFLDMTGKNDD
jgi:hypothetical protein